MTLARIRPDQICADDESPSASLNVAPGSTRLFGGVRVFAALATAGKIVLLAPPAAHVLLFALAVFLGYLLGVAVIILGGLILIQAPFFFLILRLAKVSGEGAQPLDEAETWPETGPIRRGSP